MKLSRIDTNSRIVSNVPFPRHVHEAMDEIGPEKILARGVRCSHCNALLMEFLYGVVRFTCRRCKWRGIVTSDDLRQVTINPAPEGAPRSADMAKPTAP